MLRLLVNFYAPRMVAGLTVSVLTKIKYKTSIIFLVLVSGKILDTLDLDNSLLLFNFRCFRG